GRERPHLLGSATTPIGGAHAGHHLVLGDIQPGAARDQQLHRRHLPMARGGCPAGPTEETTLKRVLTATVRGAGKAPASVLSPGSHAPRKAELGRATPILIPRGGHRPWGSYQVSRAQRCAERRSSGRWRPSGAKRCVLSDLGSKRCRQAASPVENSAWLVRDHSGCCPGATLSLQVHFGRATAAGASAPMPGGRSFVTGPACGARRTRPARTPPAGRGC